MPGPRLLGEQQRGPAHRVADAEQLAGRRRRGRRPPPAGRRASPPTAAGCPGGTTEAPWARKSIAHRSKPSPRAADIGSHTAPWKPVAWQKSVGRPVAAVLVHGRARHRRGRSPCASVHPRRAAPREANSVGAMPDPAADEEHAGDTAAEAEVRQANRRFYDAFEARDLDAMSDVWAHDDRVSCTHPGWRTLHGWGAVSGSWFALVRRSAAAAVHPHRRARQRRRATPPGSPSTRT